MAPLHRIGTTLAIVLITCVIGPAMPIHADPIFNGPGLEGGIQYAEGVTGIAEGGDPRATVAEILTAALGFASLIAVVMIIIAGFYLVLSLGNDEKKDTAKKIIFYTLIGLLVLLFARIIVGIVTVFIAGTLS